MLDSLRAGPVPLFHFDAGNLLTRGFATGGRGDARSRARLLLELSDGVGLDAWAPGSGDLVALEPETLRGLLSERRSVATCATLEGEGASTFRPSALIERAGIRVGVVGLGDPPRDSRLEKAYVGRDPVEAARGALATLPGGVDLVVGLSNLPDGVLDRVAREVPGFTVLLSTRSDRLDPPRERGGVLIFEAPDRGRYLSVLRVRLASDAARALELAETSALPLRNFDRLQEQYERLRGSDGRTEDLAETRRLLDEAGRVLEERGRGRNLAYADNLPLGESWDSDEEIERSIQRFKRATLEEAAARIARAAARPDAPPAYVSSAACYACHASRFARWAVTEHARAWETLVKRGRERDPECVTCHATGFGLDGGWAEINVQNTRKFKAVQCEACHGPGGRHVESPSANPLALRPGVCESCHDEANSPEFDHGTYLPRASCVPRPMPNPASEAAFETTLGPGASPPPEGQEPSP
jgi:hypothetical protein